MHEINTARSAISNMFSEVNAVFMQIDIFTWRGIKAFMRLLDIRLVQVDITVKPSISVPEAVWTFWRHLIVRVGVVQPHVIVVPERPDDLHPWRAGDTELERSFFLVVNHVAGSQHIFLREPF